MIRRQLTRRRTRWTVAAASAVLALLGFSAVNIPTAQAATGITDGFEGNPYSRWDVEYDHGRSLVNLINNVNSRPEGGGIFSAWFDAPTAVPARVISRPLMLDRPGSGAASCTATAYYKRAELSTGDPMVRMGVRAVDAPRGVWLGQETFHDLTTQFTLGTFANFPFPANNTGMIIEIYASRGTIFVDDVALRCAKDIR